MVRIDGGEKDLKLQSDLSSNPTNKTHRLFEWKADREKELQVPLFRCIMRHLTLVSRASSPASGAASGAPSGAPSGAASGAANGAASGAAGKRPVDEGEDPKGKRPKQ